MGSSSSCRFCVIEANNSEGFEEFSNPREELNSYSSFVVSGWLPGFIEILNKGIIQKKERVNLEERFKCISLWVGEGKKNTNLPRSSLDQGINIFTKYTKKL